MKPISWEKRGKWYELQNNFVSKNNIEKPKAIIELV